MTVCSKRRKNAGSSKVLLKKADYLLRDEASIGAPENFGSNCHSCHSIPCFLPMEKLGCEKEFSSASAPFSREPVFAVFRHRLSAPLMISVLFFADLVVHAFIYPAFISEKSVYAPNSDSIPHP